MGCPFTGRATPPGHYRNQRSRVALDCGQRGRWTVFLGGFEAFKRRSAVNSWPASSILQSSCWALFLWVGRRRVRVDRLRQCARPAEFSGRQEERCLWPACLSDGESKKEISILATFSLPTICSGAVFVPAMWLANMILVNGPGGYAEMEPSVQPTGGGRRSCFCRRYWEAWRFRCFQTCEAKASHERCTQTALPRRQTERSSLICRRSTRSAVRFFDHGQLWARFPGRPIGTGVILCATSVAYAAY